MWIEYKLKEETYFIQCKLDEKQVNCTFYNLVNCWCEDISLDALVARSKRLNKRIKYTEEHICNTLQNEQPLEMNWQEPDSDTERTLKVKYRVRSCPFHFEWHLHKTNLQELQKLIIHPLLEAVDGLCQQNAILREVVRKKDMHIQQYIKEGSILSRHTVATPPFIFSDFDTKFATTNSLIEGGLQKISAGKLKSLPAVMTTSPTNAEPTDINTKVQLENKNGETQKEIIKMNLRSRKREIIQQQAQRLELKLEASKKSKIEYESSQSQNTSQNLSQDSNDVETSLPNDIDTAANETGVNNLETALKVVVSPTSTPTYSPQKCNNDPSSPPHVDLGHEEAPESPDKVTKALASIHAALNNLEQRRIADLQERSQNSSST